MTVLITCGENLPQYLIQKVKKYHGCSTNQITDDCHKFETTTIVTYQKLGLSSKVLYIIILAFTNIQTANIVKRLLDKFQILACYVSMRLHFLDSHLDLY